MFLVGKFAFDVYQTA